MLQQGVKILVSIVIEAYSVLVHAILFSVIESDFVFLTMYVTLLKSHTQSN